MISQVSQAEENVEYFVQVSQELYEEIEKQINELGAREE